MVAQRIPQWVTHMHHEHPASPSQDLQLVDTSVVPLLLLCCMAALESRANKVEISQELLFLCAR